MGGIKVGRNLKRERVQIDLNGNEVRPFTKEVIKVKDEGYAPTQQEIAALAAKPAQDPIKPGESALGGAIAKQVEARIESAIVDALGKLDIGAMVAKALDKALQ